MAEALRFDGDAIGLYNFCAEKIQKLGMRIVEKPPSRLRLSKMATTYYREIRVPKGFFGRGWSVARRAVTLAHELIHALQWRFYGMASFALRYLSARFRWAVEMQAYRFGVLVKRMLGYLESAIQNSIRHRASAMRKPYKLRGLRWGDVKKYTPAVLNAAA